MVYMEDRGRVFHSLVHVHIHVHADIQNSRKPSLYAERLPYTNDVIPDFGGDDENCKREQHKQLYQSGFLLTDIPVAVFSKHNRTEETDEVSL